MLQDPIPWLYGLQQFGIKLGLDGIRWMLERMGHPESAYPSVLVAGTNGKGSVSAMLDAILGTSGKKTGLFTSPHLVRPNERIRVTGQDIADADLNRHLEAVREISEAGLALGALPAHPSFFEVVTATALGAFREAGVHAAILEVGLGGRLDATNTVGAVLSVVVTVDLDHSDRLGNTIEAIASEKAGIVKAGRPLVSGVLQPAAVEVLKEACRKSSSPLIEARRCSRIRLNPDGTFIVETEQARYTDLRLSLPGRHQLENAQVAIVTLENLAKENGLTVSPTVVQEGLASVRWPGRLQWVPGNPPVLLDGAHNPAGAAALAVYLRERGGRRPVLLFGAMKGKDVAGILEPLTDLIDAVVLTRPPVERALDLVELSMTVSRTLHRFEVVPEPRAALERAKLLAGPEGFVLVAGSLYLVGEILGILEGGDLPGPVPF